MNKLLCFMLVTIIFSTQPILSLIEAKNSTIFSIELIHRDSPLSPFYNHSITPSKHLQNAAHRSISRLNHFHLSSIVEKPIESPVIPDNGDYLMKLSIGTPPIEVFAIADTGSDLIWIQCMPCVQCYPQNSPIFDPTQSSTYQGLSCDSNPCKALPQYSCGKTYNECQYFYAYQDESFTTGDLTTDTFIFGSKNGSFKFTRFVFGCGRNNGGLFSSRGAGLVGLGGGPLSLISQLGSQIDHKFSYCLLPYYSNWDGGNSSKLKFGMEAILSQKEEQVVSTPLVPTSQPTFYSLTLEAISIGEKTVPMTEAGVQGKMGNIIIDSGTTFTMLKSSLYENLKAAVEEVIDVEPVEDPEGLFKLCYGSSYGFGLPDMIFHFTGADLRLKPLNTFIRVNDLDCLSIVPSDSLSIFGNLAQANFQVEYDLEGKKVSFAPADCTK